MAASTNPKLTQQTTTTLGVESTAAVSVVVAVSDETGSVVTVSDHIASASNATQATLAIAEESGFVRLDTGTGLQSVPDTATVAAIAAKRAAKTSSRLSVDTIENLTARVAELEATVARLVGCYPICSPTPTPTRTVTPTPTKTVTPSVTRSVTPTPTRIFEVSQSAAATPTVTPTITKTITPSVTPITPSVTPTITKTVTPPPSATPTPTPSPSDLGFGEE